MGESCRGEGNRKKFLWKGPRPEQGTFLNESSMVIGGIIEVKRNDVHQIGMIHVGFTQYPEIVLLEPEHRQITVLADNFNGIADTLHGSAQIFIGDMLASRFLAPGPGLVNADLAQLPHTLYKGSVGQMASAKIFSKILQTVRPV